MISKIKRWWALLWWKEGKIAPILVPYRIPTLTEVEQVKAAEQSRKELEFMSDVQQGVAAICKKAPQMFYKEDKLDSHIIEKRGVRTDHWC